MTMEDEYLFSAMTLPVVIGPIIEKLEKTDLASAQTLRSSFQKVEAEHSGFTYELVKSLLTRAEIQNSIDMTECLLRLEGQNESEEFRINRPEQAFRDLNSRATGLKKILSRIPDEIYDRKRFLETIKEIASAIKNLLDAVNEVLLRYVEGQSNKQTLDQCKRDFVKYSKKFSTTLKDFFRENEGKHVSEHDVFMSANYLMNQTNLIMKTVKESC